jgi:hypothetical protein
LLLASLPLCDAYGEPFQCPLVFFASSEVHSVEAEKHPSCHHGGPLVPVHERMVADQVDQVSGRQPEQVGSLDLPRFRGDPETGGNSLRKELTMPRSKPPHPREFREEAVRLVRSSGRPIAQIARELGSPAGP